MKNIERTKLKRPIPVGEGDTFTAEFYNGEERVGKLYKRFEGEAEITEIAAFELEPGDIEGVKGGVGGAFLEVED